MPSISSIRFHKVAVLLERRREEIVSSWLDEIQSQPASKYQNVPLENLRASIQQGVGAIIEWFATQSEVGLEVYLSSISEQRLAMGFDIGEVVEALLIWKDITLQVVREALPAGSTEAEMAVEQVDECLRTMISRFSHLYAETTQRHIREQQIRTALMYHIVQMASGSLDLEEILGRIAHAITSSLEIKYCALYLIDSQRNVLVPRVVTGELSTPRIDAFFDRCLDPTVDSLIAEMLARGEPIVCQNVETDFRLSRETAETIGVPTLLIVPSRSGSHVLGAIVVSPLGGKPAFDQAEINLMRGIANAVALTLENARLSEQAERLAVVNERHRLARELHDSLAQSLYSIMLYAEAGNESLKAGDAPTVASHLYELKGTAQEALRDLRLLIFELRPSDLEEQGLAAALQGRLDGVECRSGIQCAFHVEGDENLDATTSRELYRIAREALNNILHHANAKKVAVTLRFDPRTTALTIQDDGIGFDPDTSTGGMGLRGMRERVAQLGGTLDISSGTGSGTTIAVTCPPCTTSHRAAKGASSYAD
ncbi:MAG TPA: GAF domain-containing sensor histidine kinase [Aggregatilinea sp.]|uniref:GAF domain-containing sensor histidine kinase n=1 Tax=Aggregatilinea sp. TaxID=2806333 RepID=UPI002C963CA2|nr:GAF domain-containing sensor histidine kinase [Aggregatilinea sp.]HML22466.1 GAF domain-containing sensor histidine kinase [Aggregatilinea sp.]